MNEESVRQCMDELAPTQGSPDSNQPPKVGGFRILRTLNAEHKVYLATEDGSSQVVLKEIDDSDKHRRTLKASSLSSSFVHEHPSYVHAWDIVNVDDKTFASLEYVAGIDLEELLRIRKTLAVEDACAIIRELANSMHAALGQAEAVGIPIPTKVMLDARGGVRQLNIGPYSGLIDAEDNPKVGRYLAPEIIEDASQCTEAALVYSLGCLLTELLEGLVEPENGGSLFAEAERRKTLKSRTISDARLRPVLQRMMAERPEDRFDGLLAVAQAVLPFIGENSPKRLRTLAITIGSTSHQTTSVAKPTSWSVAWHAAKDATIVLAILFTAGFLAWSRHNSDPSETLQRRQIWNEVVALVSPDHEWWFHQIPWYSPRVRDAMGREVSEADVSHAAKVLNNYYDNTSTDAFPLWSLAPDLKQEDSRSLELAKYVPTPNYDPGKSLQENETLKRERREKLRRLIRSSADNDNDNATELHLDALLYHALGDEDSLQRAKKLYENSIALYKPGKKSRALPLFALCYADYARLQADLRDWTGALRSFDHAQTAYEQFDRAPVAFLINCLCGGANAARENDPEIAEQRLNDAEELTARQDIRPHDVAYIHERFAWFHMDRLNTAEAITHFEKAVAIRGRETPEGFHSRQGIAMALRYQGKRITAVQQFDKLIEQLVEKTNHAADGRGKLALFDRLQNCYERRADAYLYGERQDMPIAPRYGKSYNLALKKQAATGSNSDVNNLITTQLKMAMARIADEVNAAGAIDQTRRSLQKAQDAGRGLPESEQLLSLLGVCLDSLADENAADALPAMINEFWTANKKKGRDELDYILFASRYINSPGQALEIVKCARRGLDIATTPQAKRLLLPYLRARYAHAIKLATTDHSADPSVDELGRTSASSIAEWIVESRTSNSEYVFSDGQPLVLFFFGQDSGVVCYKHEGDPTFQLCQLSVGWGNVRQGQPIPLPSVVETILRDRRTRIAWNDSSLLIEDPSSGEIGSPGISASHWKTAFPSLADVYDGRELLE